MCVRYGHQIHIELLKNVTVLLLEFVAYVFNCFLENKKVPLKRMGAFATAIKITQKNIIEL